MKSLTFDGVGKIKVVDKEKPEIEQPTQAIVKLVRTTICGTVRTFQTYSHNETMAEGTDI
jgi:threonine dehydrogenase-like Zn-dependent dehydrogenase